ncbi:MAG TPA: autotransporter assembly complex family protein [Casimicrobiaceae bacterium]|jgi:translocation and assembly module TamA
MTLALASFQCVSSVVDAGEPAGATSSDTAAPAPQSRSAEAVRYRVVIDAPSEFNDTLKNSVDLVRWQSYADMTEDLFDRLTRDAVDQAREAVSTEGYFTPAIDVDIDRTTDPITVTLRIKAGMPTHITNVAIEVTGPAVNDGGAGAQAVADLTQKWGLPKGAIFRQLVWDRAKVSAVATLVASPYAAAKIVSSEARIDPATREASLHVAIDSGPAFRVGRVDITGLSRYSESLVRNYSTIKPGELYSAATLDQYLRRLNGTGYFASAQAAIDADPATADDATVKLALIEAPTKTFESGIGYSTDTEFRINARYRNVDINGHALQFYVDARIETLVQSGSIRFVQPASSDGWVDSLALKWERTNLNQLITQTATAGVRRASLDERNQWQYGAQFITDSLRPSGAEDSSSHALYFDVQRIWRRVDDLVAPTRGWIVDGQAGVGVPGASTRGFVRSVARFAYWYPVGADYQFTARLEAGAVFGASRQEVPSTLLFRTGGDTSVRGYGFESLGVKDGDATVPGRYYLVGSLEATRWINATWGIATFIDTGNAFDNVSDLGLVLGYGVGARIRTPVGPFRFDVAYGQQSRQVRLHFSVGLSF